jgi:hypothetical protein
MENWRHKIPQGPRELRRCQPDRPKPNFLILLGQRYGWRPLPETCRSNADGLV